MNQLTFSVVLVYRKALLQGLQYRRALECYQQTEYVVGGHA